MITHATVRTTRLPVGQLLLFERPSDEVRTSASQAKAIADEPLASRNDGPAINVRVDRHPAGTTDTLGRARSDGHDGNDGPDPSSDGVHALGPFSVESPRDLIPAAFRDLPRRHRPDAAARVSQRPPAELAADPFVAALARYVEALHRRYPDGPEQLRSEGLDARAIITRMSDRRKDPAA